MEPLTLRGKLLITTTGNADGIVRDNQTGADTHMSAPQCPRQFKNSAIVIRGTGAVKLKMSSRWLPLSKGGPVADREEHLQEVLKRV